MTTAAEAQGLSADGWVKGVPPEGGGQWVGELDLGPLRPRQRQALYRSLCASVAVAVESRPFRVLGCGGRRALVAAPGWVASRVEALGLAVRVVSAPRGLEVEGVALVCCTVAVYDRAGRVETATATVRFSPMGDVAQRCVARAVGRAVLSWLGLAVLDPCDVDEIRPEGAIVPWARSRGGLGVHPIVR